MSYDELANVIDAKDRIYTQFRNFRVLAEKYKGRRVPKTIKAGIKRTAADYKTAQATVERLIRAQQAGHGR